MIYVERWRGLQYVPYEEKIPIVCDPTDSMTLYNRRLLAGGSFAERILGAEEYVKFRHYERRLAEQVAASVFCSHIDLDYVRKYAPTARLVHVPNGVDCALFGPKTSAEERENTIVFAGNFSYSPNRHAVSYFLADIYPLIRRKVPDATFTIVGNQATQFVRRKYPRIAGVLVQDFVPSLRPWLAQGAIAIAPQKVGAGVSNKILEAMAVGTPIVASRVACGDLPCVAGKHLLIADDAAEFAQHAIDLLADVSLRRSMAERAVAWVRQSYDWSVVALQMEAVLLGACSATEAVAQGFRC
ncbi:MAG: glycosyltransferase [Acidobacteriota bacterium]